MELELHATREGLMAEATVINRGTDPVNYLGGCEGIRFTVLDAKGDDLLYCRLKHQCAGWGVPLLPGETVRAEFHFEGKVRGELSDQTSLEPGEYKIVAALSYFEFSRLNQLQEDRKFRWGERRVYGS